MHKMKNAFKILVRKPESKKPRCTWEDDIKVNLEEMDEVDW